MGFGGIRAALRLNVRHIYFYLFDLSDFLQISGVGVGVAARGHRHRANVFISSLRGVTEGRSMTVLARRQARLLQKVRLVCLLLITLSSLRSPEILNLQSSIIRLTRISLPSIVLFN